MAKNNPIDWEAAMTDAQKNTAVTAKMTERVASAMGEVIETQRRHSQQLGKLETTLREIKTEQDSLRSSLLDQPRPKAAPAAKKPSFPRFWLGAVFVVGAVCGGFIVSL
jgi:hypothetical protein